ncbi:MAG: hypothetical protein VKM98_03750 [Cyanobacteriota bacterium]|nr:hypothetical protein [Cyanobacteriota bacterium]
MAYCRALLPVDPTAENLNQMLTDLIDRLGMQVERRSQHGSCLIATDPPRCGLHANEHVMVLCDWSNLRNTGEVAIETRSGESMAHRDTRAQNLLQQLCRGLSDGLMGG